MNTAVQIKFCGLTSTEDALAAIAAGANLLGFNFYTPSPRSVSVETCRQILDAIRPALAAHAVRTVGVFVNHPTGQVLEVMETLALDLAQFSGDEPPEQVAALGRRGFKALRAGGDLLPFSPRVGERRGRGVRGVISIPSFLLDAAAPGQYGGTGQTADWALAARLAQRYPLLLAGGLRPDNVAAAIAAVRPWGVDTASGIESSPGKKDALKMAAFVQAVREAVSYANTI